jgi:hypothetical protein
MDGKYKDTFEAIKLMKYLEKLPLFIQISRRYNQSYNLKILKEMLIVKLSENERLSDYYQIKGFNFIVIAGKVTTFIKLKDQKIS